MRKKRKLKEYYFYKGTYGEISPENVRDFKEDYRFKVGSIRVEIYYSPKFSNSKRKRRINEYLEDYIKEKREVENAIINVSFLQNVKVSYSAEYCNRKLKLFIRTPQGVALCHPLFYFCYRSVQNSRKGIYYIFRYPNTLHTVHQSTPTELSLID